MTPPVSRPPVWRLYLYVLAPSLVVVGLVCTLAIGSVKVLGAVRAYAGGESMWSKARAEAVQHLRDYAIGRDERDFALFESALKVPLGDRRAREALGMAYPDVASIRRDFLDGGNHADDIDGMITLFRRFGEQDLFKSALDAWKEGDTLIAQLRDTAQTLHQSVRQGASLSEIRALLGDVRRINEQLVRAELRFGASLGTASRFTERLLILSIAAATLVLSLLSYLLIRRGVRREHAATQELARATRRWQMAALAAELGLFELDIHTQDMTLDTQAATLYGLPREPITLPGTELLSHVIPEDRSRARHAVREVGKPGVLFRVTLRIAMPDGQLRYLESIGSLPETSENGEPHCVIGVVRDVTQERARARLAVERDAAERVAQAQRHFLSRLSHELRTPLNAILGFAQLLSIDRQNPLQPSQHQQVGFILEAGQQLLKLIEDVLDLSKVEAGEIDMTLQPTDLGEVLRASLMLIEPIRQQHQVTIINRTPSPAPILMADPQRLQQVLLNLLSNACKYNRPGGHVSIDTRTEGDRLCVDIADNGIGFTPEDAAELFQPFRRVTAVSATVEGSGLGLYIVKQLVERMQGEVQVSSEPGVGSRFSVCLPIAG